jgi:hypothetical protein
MKGDLKNVIKKMNKKYKKMVISIKMDALQWSKKYADVLFYVFYFR